MIETIRPNVGETRRRVRRQTLLDVVLILGLGVVAQATFFSAQQGRAVICADSAQYVAAAQAMIDGDSVPHFEMRKPGYILMLALIGLTVGNMGWAAIVGNHLWLATLPLAGYLLGRQLHSRAVGWVAVFLTVAQLQTAVQGNRMMSESLFIATLSYGIIVVLAGWKASRPHVWLAAGGTLLGLAWLVRGAATPVIAALAVFLAVSLWRATPRSSVSDVLAGHNTPTVSTRPKARGLLWKRGKRVALCLSCFGFPIVLLFVFECSLNASLAGRFRPTNGTAGALLTLRLRYFDGAPLPLSKDADAIVALLPERSRDDAFVGNRLDVWLARYHAIHDRGMDEWEYDDLMGCVGWEMVKAHPFSYLASSAKTAAWHLLRQGRGLDLSSVADERRMPCPIHAAAPNAEEGERYWYAYYGLPHMPLEDSIAFVDRMKTAAMTRAPFGGERIWSNLRYYLSKPTADHAMVMLRWLGTLWPGLALLACFWLRLDRGMCFALTLMFLADAVFIGLITPTDHRFQFIWVVPDTVLAASFVTIPALRLIGYVKRRLRPSGVYSPSGGPVGQV